MPLYNKCNSFDALTCAILYHINNHACHLPRVCAQGGWIAVPPRHHIELCCCVLPDQSGQVAPVQASSFSLLGWN